jgi:hypothetical protein
MNPHGAIEAVRQALDESLAEFGIAGTWLVIDAWLGQNVEALLRHFADHPTATNHVCSILEAVPQAETVLALFEEAAADMKSEGL